MKNDIEHKIKENTDKLRQMYEEWLKNEPRCKFCGCLTAFDMCNCEMIRNAVKNHKERTNRPSLTISDDTATDKLTISELTRRAEFLRRTLFTSPGWTVGSAEYIKQLKDGQEKTREFMRLYCGIDWAKHENGDSVTVFYQRNLSESSVITRLSDSSELKPYKKIYFPED